MMLSYLVRWMLPMLIAIGLASATATSTTTITPPDDPPVRRVPATCNVSDPCGPPPPGSISQ